MRQLDLLVVRRTGRLLAIVLATAGLVNGAEELKSPYPPRLELHADSSGHYGITVMDGGLLSIKVIPKGVTIAHEGCELDGSKLTESRSYPLRQGCKLQFQVSSDVPPVGLVISAMAQPAGDAKPQRPIRFVLLGTPPTTMNRVLSALSSTYALGVLLLLAGAGLGVFLWVRKQGDQGGQDFQRTGDGRSQRQGMQAKPLAPSASAPGALSPSLSPVQYASKSDLDILNRSLQNLDTNFWNLANAQKRQNSELGTQLSQFVERCQTAAEEAVERSAISALRAAGEATKETERMRRRVEALESDLNGLRTESSKGLSNLLQALPREALTGLSVSHQAGSDLAQKLEQSVARYLREEQPCAQSLAAHTQQVGTLRSAIKQFMQVASESAAGQADPRLDPLERDLDLIAQELAGFTRQGTDKRFRLLFAVDFSANETARQTLTEGIAAGLQREIVKLDNLDDYYTKRIGMLAAQVAAECADLADSVLDPQRSKPDVKSALQSVFTVAGVEEIAPRRNDPFLGTDHAMFQMIRRSSAVDRSGAVAQTVSRGLRQRDRVVRKATVTLFE